MEWQPRGRKGPKRGMLGTLLKGEEFTCAVCHGKGTTLSEVARCPACEGRGLVKVGPPAVVCAYCMGQGNFPVGSSSTCPVCGGQGVVGVRAPVEVCPDCRGTGATAHTRLPCLWCGGKGLVSAKDKEVTVPPADALLPDLAHQEAAVARLSYLWQPKQPTSARGVSANAVHTLVRCLMAAERARLLGRRALDPGQYPMRKKAQRWKEVRQPFK